MIVNDRAASRALPPRDATSATPSPAQDAFARAMRQQDGANEDAGDASAPPAPDPSDAGALAALAAAAAPTPEAGDGGAGGAAGAGGAGGAAGASPGASASALASLLAPVNEGDSTGWEASVRDGSGLDFTLRAQPAAPGAGDRAAWSVTVSSPALAGEAAARHAPRLVERLQSLRRGQGIATHVRIDGSADEGDADGARP